MGDGAVVVALAAVASLYARGTTRHPIVPGRQGHRQLLAFAAALTAMLVVISEPFDRAAHSSLAMHMLQHVVLLGVVPPLLAVSAPLAVFAAALPRRARSRAESWLRRALRSQSRHWGAWTAAAFALATTALVAWHLPGPYDAAVRRDLIHVLEHLGFVVTGTLFWWMALGAGRPARRGAGVLVVFASSLPATALGVAMVLASTSWYTAYGTGPGAVRDQQVAGAVMWGFGSVALVASAAALFAGWLAAMDRADAARAVHGVAERW